MATKKTKKSLKKSKKIEHTKPLMVSAIGNKTSWK